MKVYGLPSGQGLDSRNDMATASGSGPIILGPGPRAVHKIHSALSFGYYCLIIYVG